MVGIVLLAGHTDETALLPAQGGLASREEDVGLTKQEVWVLIPAFLGGVQTSLSDRYLGFLGLSGVLTCTFWCRCVVFCR